MINKRGQATLESSLIFILVAAAFLAMYGFLHGAISGQWKTNADSFSDERYEEGISDEKVSALTFIAPKLKADIGMDESFEQTYDVALRKNERIQVQGWGTYK